MRKTARLSQERLGHRSGLSGKFIGEVERGEKSISIDSLYRVATDGLEVPLEAITGGLNGKKVDNSDLIDLNATLIRKPPAVIKRARDVVRALVNG
jgi:transcriptional regulator with XRE-family HTH domain